MTTPTNDHARRHGGWQRRRVQGREALLRTATAPEPAAAEAAEAQWLDDGGQWMRAAIAHYSVTAAGADSAPRSHALV